MATGFSKTSAGNDIGNGLVPKSYITDNYKDLSSAFVYSGLWAWGNGSNGALGNLNTFSESSPVIVSNPGSSNWKSVSAGSAFGGAIKTDGSLWMWGSGTNGRLGDNTTVAKSSPVQTTLANNDWVMISCGQSHVTAVKGSAGYSWGLNFYGQLGDNSTTDKSSPVMVVPGGTFYCSAGIRHSAFLQTVGVENAIMMGDNSAGQLGDGTTNSTSGFVLISGTGFVKISCGADTTAAIKKDGTLWMWGSNSVGQLGTNDTTPRSSPVQTVSGGTNWKQVSCGGNLGVAFTAAIKTDGTLWLWGYNQLYGQLGDNTTTNRSSPVQTVAAGTNWKQVSCGEQHTAAIKTDGTLWMWGDNGSGRLGTDNATDRSSPVQTVASGTNWFRVSAGYEHNLAIRDESSDLL